MSYKKWTKISVSVFLLIVIITAILTSVAFANDGVLGMTPDGVYPITQSDIVMLSEEIHIQLLDNTNAKVTCRFNFQNFGDAQTVLMGFPAELDEFGEMTPPEAFWAHHFTARDENGDLEVTLVDTIPNPPLKEINQMEKYKKWYSFSVDFASNEVKTLHHTYDISLPYYSTGDVQIGYVLETGALWKGSLGHSKVIFVFGTLVKDGNLGTLIGTPSSNSPSCYGDILKYRMPNSRIKASISFKRFLRPDTETDQRILMPDIVTQHNDDILKVAIDYLNTK